MLGIWKEWMSTILVTRSESIKMVWAYGKNE